MSEWDSLSKWVLGRGGKGPKLLSQAYCGCAAAMERCRMRQGSSLAEHPLDDSDSAALLPAALMQITDRVPAATSHTVEVVSDAYGDQVQDDRAAGQFRTDVPGLHP